MLPRRAIPLLLPLVVLAACGDDSLPAADSVPAPTLPPVTTAPPITTPPPTTSPDYSYATGADDVVISVEYEGGFVPLEMLFARTPVAQVTGDGRALSTGPVPAIYPGPLLPNVLQRTITPEATEELLALADELGLLADIAYARNDMVADAPDTVVTITVDGTTYEHRAYALGIDVEDDPDRDRLMQFVTAMTDLAGTVGEDQLGPEEPFASDDYLIRATPVDLATLDFEVEPTVVEWPVDAPVRLADAADCAEIPVAVGDPLFVDATALTFFTDAGTTYQVSVVPQLPAREC